jgi:AcrR family transcriptional regulator
MSPRKYDMSKRAARVSETRARIVDATRRLHNERGIAATTWDEIAERAGVGVGTVYRHFPTLDELIPACGAVSMQIVSLPRLDQVPEIFAGCEAARARVDRLVTEVFSIYERGADDLRALVREPNVHPAVGAAADQLDATLTALAKEALSPLRPNHEDRRLARALLDLRTWEALRAQGMSSSRAARAVADMLVARLDRKDPN